VHGHPEHLATLLGAPIFVAVAVALVVFWRTGRGAFDGSIRLGYYAVAAGLAIFAVYWAARLATHVLPLDILSRAAPTVVHTVVGHGITFTVVILVALGLAVGSRGTIELIRRLKEQDAHLRRTQRQGKIAHWRWSFDEARLTSCSSRDFSGCGADSIEPDPSYEQTCSTVHPEDLGRVVATYQDADRERSGFDIHYRRVRPDGVVIHIHEIAEVEYDADGRPVAQLGIIQDISDLKRAEAVRESAELQFEHAERIANLCHWQMSLPDLTWTQSSKNTARMFGVRSVDDLLGDLRPFFALVHPEDRAWLSERYDELVRDPKRLDHTYRIVHSDGSLLYLNEVGEPVLDALGRATAIRGTTRDVTAEHEAEAKARKREAALSLAQRMARLGYWRFSLTEGRLIDWSRPYAEIFGVSFEDGWRTAQYDLEFVHPEDRAAVRETYSECNANNIGYDHEYRILRAAGDVRYIREIGEPEGNDDGTASTLFGTVQDVTEQKLTTEALRRSEARFSGIVELAPEGIVSVDENGIIRLFNRGAETIFGYSAGEIIGQPLNLLLPESMRERHTAHIVAFAKSPEQSVIMNRRGEIAARHKDGREFPAEVSISKLKLGGEMIFTAMIRDISDMKRNEKTLRHALEEAEIANRAKSEFLANMSHELRTPLNAIIGFSELIEGQAFGEISNARYTEYAGDIRESGQHLLSLINDILDLSKVESGSVEPKDEIFEAEKVLRSCVALVSERARNNEVDIEVSFPAASPMMLRADRRMFKQILSNLLSNAVKFTPSAGRITVTAHVDGEAGLAIEVRDTGIGMAEKDIPKALTRFGQVESHLDRKYEGTGLGLPLVKSLIELHGGFLDLRSELHRGTCATVVFPPERIVEPKPSATGTSGA